MSKIEISNAMVAILMLFAYRLFPLCNCQV